MDNFDLRKYLAEGRLLKEDIASKAISVLKSYEGEVEGVEGYIKYLMNTSDDISSSIQAIADDLDRDKPSSDSLRRDLEKLSLAEGKILKENKYDIDDPNSPLGQLNDNDQDVAILNNMTKKYGKDVVLMWMSSGEYGDREYFEEGKLYEEDLDLHPDYDKDGKYYSEEGAEAFRIQPFKKNDIKYTKDQAVRQGKHIVGLEGEELKKFISSYMDAWKEDVGDTPKGKTFK